MSEHIDDPDFGYDEELKDNNPAEEDWSRNPDYVTFKSEHDVHSRIINPYSRTAYKIGKGIDPATNKVRMGVIPSGFMEANTPDLTTANLKVDSLPKNYDERFNLMCNNTLASLKNFNELTGIDVAPSYNLVLAKRDLYNSMTKARHGKLMEYAFVHKSDQIVTRTDIAKTSVPKKAGLADKIFGSKVADE